MYFRLRGKLMSDLVSLLRELGGPDEPPSADAYQGGLDALTAELTQDARAPRSRRRHHPGRRRRRIVMLAPLAALAVAGVGYAALESGAPASAGVECHARASATGDEAGLQLDGRSPVAICAQVWREGGLSGAGESGSEPPPLQACVAPGEGRAVQVFPAADSSVCGQLGFSPAPAHEGTTEADQSFIAFKNETFDQVMSVRCRAEADARTVVRRELQQHHLAGWRIDIGGGIHGEGFSTQRPCATPAFDSQSRTVTLIPTSMP